MARILAREERERTKKNLEKKKLSGTLKMVLKFLIGGHALLDGRSHSLDFGWSPVRSQVFGTFKYYEAQGGNALRM